MKGLIEMNDLNLIFWPRRIGSAANITSEDWPRMKNSNAYWKAWRMKHRGQRTEGRERFQPDPQGEKNLLENVPWAGEIIFKPRVFFRWEKNQKHQGHRSLGIIFTNFGWNQPCKIGQKMNKESVYSVRHYPDREFSDIWYIFHYITLNLV